MLTPEIINYLSITAWLIAAARAYKSGCSGGYCFVITDIQNTNEFLDQSTAQQRCQSNGTQLVEIRNQDIQNNLVNFISSQTLNGWNVLTNGKRTLYNTWLRVSGIGTVGLDILEQTDASYAYGYLKSTTSRFDLYGSRPAVSKDGFICAGLSDCSGGVTISDQCYKTFTESLSWYDARNRCLDGGGDLASFDYITSNAGFKALNGSWISASYSYWIGIRREWWTWQASYSDVRYSDWMTGHPVNEVNRQNADCLCLSPNAWVWTECGCTQHLPFVCLSDSPTSSTTKKNPTTTSTVSFSTTKTTTSGVVSQNNGVSLPTILTTVTSKSTPIGNVTGVMDLSREATLGIGVGVGVGGALVIIALVAAVLILCRKRCPLRYPQRKKTTAKANPPDILMTDSVNNNHSSDGLENPYARIVSSSPDSTDTGAHENVSQAPTVYAELGFCAEPQLHRPGSVTIVPGKTKPSPNSTLNIPNNNTDTHHFRVGGALYAEVTKTEV